MGYKLPPLRVTSCLLWELQAASFVCYKLPPLRVTRCLLWGLQNASFMGYKLPPLWVTKCLLYGLQIASFVGYPIVVLNDRLRLENDNKWKEQTAVYKYIHFCCWNTLATKTYFPQKKKHILVEIIRQFLLKTVIWRTFCLWNLSWCFLFSAKNGINSGNTLNISWVAFSK